MKAKQSLVKAVSRPLGIGWVTFNDDEKRFQVALNWASIVMLASLVMGIFLHGAWFLMGGAVILTAFVLWMADELEFGYDSTKKSIASTLKDHAFRVVNQDVKPDLYAALTESTQNYYSATVSAKELEQFSPAQVKWVKKTFKNSLEDEMAGLRRNKKAMFDDFSKAVFDKSNAYHLKELNNIRKKSGLTDVEKWDDAYDSSK